MIGNPSTPATTLSILALHTTILSRPIIAQDAAASAAIDNERPQTQWKKRHLRRPVIEKVEGNISSSSGTSTASSSEQIEWSNQHNGHNERLYKLRNILEYSGAAFLKGEQQSSTSLPEYEYETHAIDLHANDEQEQPSWLDDWKDHIIHFNFNTNNNENGGDCAASSQYWYPDLTSSTHLACTNSLLHYHPTSWESEASISEIVMFTSGEECCTTLQDMMMGEDDRGFIEGEMTTTCLVHDECNTNNSHGAPFNQIMLEHDTDIPAVIDNENENVNQQQKSRRRLCAAAASLGFHPDTQNEKGCTNSKEYPPPWERDQLKERMFYTDPNKCCEFFFKGVNEECPIRNVCPPPGSGSSSPPPPPKAGPPPPAQPGPSPPASGVTKTCLYHIDVKAQDGCTDSIDYPDAWKKPPMIDNMMFATAKECCDRMFPGKPCKQKAVGCDGPAPTPPPTPKPMQTPRPTQKPRSRPPTRRPTPRPTWEPTRTPIIYYVDEASGMCVSNYEMEKPEWIKVSYPFYDLCCRQSRDPKTCMKARPTEVDGMPMGTLRPTPTPPAVYYADPNTGLCANDAVVPKPSWLKTVFDDYKRCCVLASSNAVACLANEAKVKEAPDPWSSDSIWPTVTPDPVYYLQDSSAVCVNKFEVPPPYAVPKEFDDYDACCKTSWNGVKCMADKPTKVPTANPSFSPSTPWPTGAFLCPEEYDESRVYKKHDEVAVNEVVYSCRKPPFTTYCNKPEFQPPQEDPGPDKKEEVIEKNTGGVGVIGIPITNNIPISGASSGSNNKKDDALWKEAWERLYQCAYTPTASPTIPPSTGTPTCTTTKWHPFKFNRKICTNGDEYPSMWNEEPLASTYFVETAEECCEKFYPGSKCRIRDVC